MRGEPASRPFGNPSGKHFRRWAGRCAQGHEIHAGDGDSQQLVQLVGGMAGAMPDGLPRPMAVRPAPRPRMHETGLDFLPDRPRSGPPGRLNRSRSPAPAGSFPYQILARKCGPAGGSGRPLAQSATGWVGVLLLHRRTSGIGAAGGWAPAVAAWRGHLRKAPCQNETDSGVGGGRGALQALRFHGDAG